MNPWRRLLAYIEWRRRDRQETVIGTSTYRTVIVHDDGSETGRKHDHVVVFLVDGNGVRYSRVETTDARHANAHGGLLGAKSDWKYHGELPSNVQRVNGPKKGNLVVFPGGAA